MGIQKVHWDNGFLAYWDTKQLHNILLGMPRRPCLAVRQYRVLPRECFVYVVHATALTIFGIFFMHVQVTTRLLLASSPVLPWLAAILTTMQDKPAVALAEGEEAQAEALLKIECKTNLESSTDTILFQEKLDTDVSRWVMMYFLGYTLVGTILFCNHLPWT